MKLLLPDGYPAIADPIDEILQTYNTIAVVGLSSDPTRPSHGVARYLQDAGYTVIPVNPNEREVLGEKSYERIEDVPEKIDVVDIFRRPEHIPAIVESAIRASAKVIWMQLGLEHDEAAEKARGAGLVVVMNACMLIEHKKRRRSLSV